MNKHKLTVAKQRRPQITRGVIAVLTLIMILLVIFIGTKQPESSVQEGTVEFAIATQELSPGEDLIVSLNDVTLYVPKDAVNLPGTISITPLPPNLFSIAEKSEWSRSLVVNIEFQNEKGTPYSLVALSIPVEVCFKVIQERWLDYLNRPDEYQVQYYAEGQDPPGWEPLPMVTYPQRNELCGQTDHLSPFALAIKLRPGMPDVGVILTPTPEPNTLFNFLKDLIGSNSDGTSSGGVYEP